MKAHVAPKSRRPNPLPEGEGDERSLAWLTRFALFVAVALVLARGMMLEMVRDPFQVEVGSQPVPRGPGAATGLVLDLLCCVPALLVLLRGAIDRSYVIRRSLAHVPMIALAVWTILSPLWASDKFLAAMSAAHWLSALVLLWATSQLVREWSALRFVAAAAFGLLLVLAAHGIIYRLVELPELKQQVERDWPRILRERGWEPDSYIASRFKMRVMAGEMIGFNASPNSFGAAIVMLGIVAAGLGVQRIVNRDEWGWPVVIAASLVPAGTVLMLTNSRTAMATPVLAAATFSIAWFGRRWLVRHRRLVFAGAMAMILVGIAAAVAHGIYRGTLFHESLTFRWKYWVGAWRVFVEHPLHGVGFANFGPHYLGTRLPEAAEEINDPHNFVVRFFTELGVVGGALLIAWMLRLWWELTRPVRPADAAETRAPIAPTGDALVRLLQLAAAATVIAIVSAVDFTQQWEFGFMEVFKRALYMLLLVIGLAVGMLRSSRLPTTDDRPAPLLLYAMLVAVGIFLVHNLVDFSLFEAGPMFFFALLTGAVMGIRSNEAKPIGRRAVLVALALGSLAWFTAAIGFVAPVALAEGQAHRGDDHLRAGSPALAVAPLRRAFESLWISNGDYAFRAARAMVAAGFPPDQVRATVQSAISASPMSAGYPRLRAEYELRQPAPDPARVVADFERVIALDPNEISARLDYARALERFGRREDARRQYEEVLRLNDLMDPAEPERLPPLRIEEIQSTVQSLRP